MLNIFRRIFSQALPSPAQAGIEKSRRSKPTWIVYGNCNADALAGFLRDLTDVGDRYEIVWARSYNATEPVDFSRCKRLWVQHDEANPLSYPKHLRAISFPPCNSSAIWPFSTVDPVMAGEHSPFPYGDEIAIRLSEDLAVAEDRIYDAYLDIMRGESARFDERYEHDRDLRRRRDDACQIKFSPFFDANFQSQRLQMTYNHPRLDTLLNLFYALCRASGLNPAKAARQRAARWAPAYQPFDSLEVPVLAPVIDHFKLQWAPGIETWRVNERSLTPRDYITQYVVCRRAKQAASPAA